MSQENQRTYCNKNRFLPKSMEEKFSKEIKNLAKTTDRTVQIEGNTRASEISRFTEKALEERNDFLCLRHPWGTEPVKLGPFFENLSNRGRRHLRRIFRHLEPFRRSPTFPRSCHRVVSSRPFQSTHRACNPRPLSPSLPAWLHSGKIIAAKSQFLDGARWSREKRREESCWNKRGLASLSFPSEKGWKQRGRGKQRARTAKTADVTCLFFTIEAHCS